MKQETENGKVGTDIPEDSVPSRRVISQGFDGLEVYYQAQAGKFGEALLDAVKRAAGLPK